MKIPLRVPSVVASPPSYYQSRWVTAEYTGDVEASCSFACRICHPRHRASLLVLANVTVGVIPIGTVAGRLWWLLRWTGSKFPVMWVVLSLSFIQPEDPAFPQRQLHGAGWIPAPVHLPLGLSPAYHAGPQSRVRSIPAGQ